jgi:prolyl oligopeptidase
MNPRIASTMIVLAAALASHAIAGDLDYPNTNKLDHTDTYHGITVDDPYQWLEEDVRESQRVEDWVGSQNKVTYQYLESLPERKTIEERLTKLWNYERFSSPSKVGSRYSFSKNDGLQNQSVVYLMDSLEDEPRVLFNPNTWSEDGTIALSGLAFSRSGRYAAYGIQDGGSDWRTWKVRDVETGEDLADRIEWVKFSGISWTPDNRGFFYSRYDQPEEGQEFQQLNKFQKVYYHRIGSTQDQDVLVYHRDDEPDWGFGASVSEDGQYLVMTVWKGTDNKYQVVYKDLAEPYSMPVSLIDSFENDYSFIGNDGPIFYFYTDYQAPRFRVIAIDVNNPSKDNWREVIPQSDNVLRGINIVGNMFACTYLQDASTRFKLFDMTGRHIRDVDLPGIGASGGFGGLRKHTETFYSFSSFNAPPSIYRYDMITGESSLLRRAKVDFNPDDYSVKQVFYSSKDGTRVPMFIAHKKDIVLDGNNPTLLYGYGGFNISLSPYFSTSRLAWMEMGGVFAMPNLRGGGEYGVEWHEAGKKMNKQNVFDDFISAGEWLISNGYTNPDKLAIQGGSNGGLLVGACMTQRPELFAAALPAVGVMDMLKFQNWTAGRFWVDDYGSAQDSKEMFEYLKGYSPYHNLKPGTDYPATMVTTADYDDRVVPGHSFKFASRLQECHTGDSPVLIRIETRAGHGSGKPTEKIIEEVADLWAFLVKNLDMEIEPHLR